MSACSNLAAGNSSWCSLRQDAADPSVSSQREGCHSVWEVCSKAGRELWEFESCSQQGDQHVESVLGE